jgi:hypothetical protein
MSSARKPAATLGPRSVHTSRRCRRDSRYEGAILLIPSAIDQRSSAFTRAAAACAFQLTNH